MLGIKGNHAAAGGAAGRLNPHAVLQRNCQQAIGICLSQILLRQEGQLVKIVNGFDVIGSHSLFLHQMPVIRYIFIDSFHCGDQALILPGSNLIPAGTFNFGLIITLHRWVLSFLYNIYNTIPFYSGKVNNFHASCPSLQSTAQQLESEN